MGELDDIHCLVHFGAYALHLIFMLLMFMLLKSAVASKSLCSPFFRSLQCLIAKVNRAAVVRLKDKETNGHGAVCLSQHGMRAIEELIERNQITQWFTHFCSVNGNHVVVHPVVNQCRHPAMPPLCYFYLWWGKTRSMPPPWISKCSPKILTSHGGTFAMPSGETIAPRRWPLHDVLRLCALPPESKVGLIASPVRRVAGGVQHRSDYVPNNLP